jgi:hypothetical protein
MDFVTFLATHFFGSGGTEINPQGQKVGATKGVWNDANKSAGKQYIKSAPPIQLQSKVAEISGVPMNAPKFGGLKSRLADNRQRQLGLIRNKRLKGLLT